MTDLVFFYGTLMTGFRRPARLDLTLRPVGRGSIAAALFDLGIYPAAVPAGDSRVWGEIHQMLDTEVVLATLDEIEGFSADDPESSLYLRAPMPVTLERGDVVTAWVYLYNAPLGRAERIVSGDYRDHLRLR